MINQDKAENENAKKNINPADQRVELRNILSPSVVSSAILFLLSLNLIPYHTKSTKGIKKNIDDPLLMHKAQ